MDQQLNIILATAGYDKQIKFWNIKNCQCYESKKFGDNAINKLVLSADKKYLGACTLGHVKVYDLRNPDQERTFDGHNGNVIAMDFCKNNKWFFTACEDGTLKTFDFKGEGFQR
jgi:G protein beta subunit-like protein